MAFSSEILGRAQAGGSTITWGTWTTSSTETGGDIDTGLHSCQAMQLTQTSGSVATNAAVVNETLPVAGSAVTIVQDASGDGSWVAFGDF